jgi:hypothetical protein
MEIKAKFWIEKITTKAVVRGIMLGLGLSFIVEG